MDKRKVKADGRAFAVKDLTIAEVYKDPGYQIELYHNNKATDTMHLIIGKLISSDPSLPYFIFRWDEKQDQFDVDIENVDNETKEKFKAGKDGYSGHHPRRFLYNGRCMEVDISLPNKRIFKGTIKVPVIKEEKFNMYFTINANGRITMEKEHPFISRIP
jgi:hypothetical protein